MTKEEFGKTVFVSVKNTWGKEIKSEITGERVSLADCAMGYWRVANSPKIEQCEWLMAIGDGGAVIGVWEINRQKGWLRPDQLPKRTWPEDDGGTHRESRRGCELLEAPNDVRAKFLGVRPYACGIETRGGALHYSF